MSSAGKMFVVAMAMFGLSILTAGDITPESHLDRLGPGLATSCQKLIFFPEPPLLFRIMFALHLQGLVQPNPRRTDIVWEDGKFHYIAQ